MSNLNLNELKNSAHLVMQSKGGAGKSVTATILSQWIKNHFADAQFFDTDPSNKTLSGFKSLNVKAINIINPTTELVDQSNFDILIESILENDNPSVVDTGSGEFLPITNYLYSSNIIEILEDAEKSVYFHVIITYGQSMADTIACLLTLMKNFPTAKFILWLNEYFGAANQDIRELKALTPYKSQIKGYVTLHKLNADTHERDFVNVLKSKLTFSDVIENGQGDFGVINKSRLKRISAALFEQIDNAFADSE